MNLPGNVTPVPIWYADGPHVVSPGNFYAHVAGTRFDSKVDLRAAARLMAAAPQLLEALQGVLRVADRATDEFDAARAAIAKATTP